MVVFGPFLLQSLGCDYETTDDHTRKVLEILVRVTALMITIPHGSRSLQNLKYLKTTKQFV